MSILDINNLLYNNTKAWQTVEIIFSRNLFLESISSEYKQYNLYLNVHRD